MFKLNGIFGFSRYRVFKITKIFTEGNPKVLCVFVDYSIVNAEFHFTKVHKSRSTYTAANANAN